jgi:transglutaminase-like putative cysteine protease
MGSYPSNRKETHRSVEADGKAAAEFKSTPRYILSLLFWHEKMKKGILLSLFFLLLVSAPAYAIWYFDSQYVTVDLKISSGLNIDRKPDSTLDYVTANVTFIPKDTATQSILSVTTDPAAEKTDDVFVFRWTGSIPEEASYRIDSRVKISNVRQDIGKIDFPYLGFNDDISQFLQPGVIIDSNDSKVIDKASELAEGQTDYYVVVDRIAEWTRQNVKYDLSTLNAKATYKASWVLAKKDGVCDEISTLFIALLRAVGIPARFVSGIAYTDSPKFPQKWGAHGWAEVYFPGVGWVPYDVTYAEYGFVDPTHIILKRSFDSGEPDTRYEWLGKDLDVSANPIVVEADLVKSEGFVKDPLTISVSPVQKNVGIGSYDVVEAKVTNTIDSYVSTFLFLAKINELEADHEPLLAMIKPYETKSFYWLVRVIDDLDPGYTYTFPLTAADSRNMSADSEFYVLPGATVFSKDEMENVILAAKNEDEKVYSKKIDINCSSDKDLYYIYDAPKLDCYAKNTGNVALKGLDFCFNEDCVVADLAISQQKSFGHIVESPKSGVNKITFSIEGKDVSKSFFYDLDVLDAPKITIDDMEYPAGIEFDKPYTVKFTLKKSSVSMPENVSLVFDAAGLSQRVDGMDMDSDRKMLFNLDSSALSLKPNKFVISVSYLDRNNKIYTEEEDFTINLENVTFSQRVVIFLMDADRWLRNLFK